ncbi:MAG: hypothetical protein LBU90_03825 [Bacteroidales bacterium]|nr:hypothetical protein [Bacteroidales bacterium]
MTELYVTHTLSVYAEKNAKCAAMGEIARQYENVLISSRLSLDALKAEIQLKMLELNETYPRTKALMFSEYEHNSRHVSWRCYIPGRQLGFDHTVWTSEVKRVRSIYQFSEQLNIES